MRDVDPKAQRRAGLARVIAAMALAPIALSVAPGVASLVVPPNSSMVEYAVSASSRDANLFS
jgi:hypothetical protein